VAVAACTILLVKAVLVAINAPIRAALDRTDTEMDNLALLLR